ncbi:MAG: LytTR family DNA-binding domain-containing protein [Tannerellaceae bacterium]|jgi:DNA-binding LytR/AlgR family response regulator|nr:LytTR family DNA-binding domain-containing protein [Tannerellaceae bacterium]
MNVLIIEDERPASAKLIRLLAKIDPSIEVIDVLRSVEQSVNWFHSHPLPALIFMDIQLEDGLSFELFENCRIETPVIFTTAYDAYMLKAFKVNSVDYLLKPISSEELSQALTKYNTLHRPQPDYSRLESIINQLQQPIKTKERFLIKIGEHYRSVAITDILCFYIRERSTFLFTKQGKHYPADYSLDKIESVVDPQQFFRINRHFIIRFEGICDILAYSSNRLKITLSGWKEEEILVSRERVVEFKKWIDR